MKKRSSNPPTLAEQLGPDEHRRAGAEQDVLAATSNSPESGLLDLALVAHAEPGQRAVDVVDRLAVPVEHLAGDRADVRRPARAPRRRRGSSRGSGRASLLRKATYSPRGVRDAEVAAAGEAACSSPASTTTRVRRRAARIRSTLPSPESLSTTMSSSRSAGQSTSANDRRQVIVSWRPGSSPARPTRLRAGSPAALRTDGSRDLQVGRTDASDRPPGGRAARRASYRRTAGALGRRFRVHRKCWLP